MNDAAWKGGNYDKNTARPAEVEFGDLFLTSPEHFNQSTTRERLLQELANAPQSTLGLDANDKIRQSQAMMAFDVSLPFAGSMDGAAAAVKAKVFVVASKNDLPSRPDLPSTLRTCRTPSYWCSTTIAATRPRL
jgi:homoserine acetyltransferase